jgi:hypothetical protein
MPSNSRRNLKKPELTPGRLLITIITYTSVLADVQASNRKGQELAF